MDLLRLKNSSNAVVAQLVEHLICNQAVGGSTPSDGTDPEIADNPRVEKHSSV